jgi:hypothetical protein
MAGAGGAMLSAALVPQRTLAMTPDEIKRQVEAYRQQALANFPLKLVETTGDQALSKWQELKSADQGIPVVLGGDDEMHPFSNLLDPFGPNGPNIPPPQPVDEILRAAEAIRFPDDLAKRRKVDSEAALARFRADLAAKPDMALPQIIETKDGKSRTYSRAETIAAMEAEPHEPKLGEWPSEPDPSPGLSVAYDLLKVAPLPKVYIGIAPTNDWTTIPAYLRWGGWNDCPAAEYHVAAMRLWRDLYGAELIGMSFDTINLRVSNKPKTREEALALARSQYVYCADVIDQGVQTYSALAADLMANDWWYFWWD